MLTRDPFAKPFAWSYSRLKSYETCPYKHLRIDIMRDVKEPESDDLKWGNRLHDAMARAIGTDDNDSRPPRDRIVETPLAPELAH
jgi:ATP-dependent helicase/DNAse subunit B